jgi:hypothetical protein
MATDDRDEADKPSLRQRLHWATGDREAEGKALADNTEGDVSEEDATTAVRRAHGDLGIDETAPDDDVAKPVDAEAEAQRAEGEPGR